MRKSLTKYIYILIIFLVSGNATLGQGMYSNSQVYNATFPFYNDGSIILNINSISQPVTYTWSNGATTKNIFNLTPGNYSVTYTDVINQTEIDSFEIGIANNLYHFPWSPTITLLEHTIHFPGGNIGTVNGQNLVFGDSIGVFYDSINHWACGGFFVYDGNPHTITVYGDVIGISGFTTGEQFKFLIRSQLYNLDFIAWPLFDAVSYPNSGSFVNGGSSGIIQISSNSGDVLQSSLQTATIGNNNMFYPWLEPVIPLISNIFPQGSYPYSYELVKDSLGNIYWPAYGINFIGDVYPNSTYFTFMNSTDYIQYEGNIIDDIVKIIKVNTCYGNPDGYIYLLPVFGLPPYTYNWNTGSSSNVISDINPYSTYSVTITDVNGIQQSHTITTHNGDEIPEMNFTIVDATNNYGGSAEINVPSTPDYLTLPCWSSGDCDTIITNQSAGIYDVTIESAFGCYYDTSVTIGYTTFSYDILSINLSCYNDSTGSIWIDTISGPMPMTYIWSNGNTSDSIVGLTAGDYTVSVIAANGDTSISIISLTQPTEIVASISSTLADPALQINGSISTMVSGGVPPYNYLWSDGSTESNMPSAPYGSYNLTITDSILCSIEENIFVDLNILPEWQMNYDNSYNSHSILIPTTSLLLIDGLPIEQNDFIGVFYDSAGTVSCGGYVVYQGQALTLMANGDNPTFPGPQGFSNGETFQWKIWDASENVEYIANPTYASAMPNNGQWEVNGMSMLITLNSLGINDPSINSDIRIFPNPVANTIFVETNNLGSSIIKMYNISGQEIDLSNKTILSEHKFSIDMKALNPGIYILEITNDSNRHVHKINKL